MLALALMLNYQFETYQAWWSGDWRLENGQIDERPVGGFQLMKSAENRVILVKTPLTQELCIGEKEPN